eukprot:1140443-Pelagomonas_calceolata.AAC.6
MGGKFHTALGWFSKLGLGLQKLTLTKLACSAHVLLEILPNAVLEKHAFSQVLEPGAYCSTVTLQTPTCPFKGEVFPLSCPLRWTEM